MKTADLIGPALNWAVSVAAGHQSRCAWMLEKQGWIAWQSYEAAWGNPIPDYSTDWTQGGPIIEQEKIDIYHHTRDSTWAAAIWVDEPGGGQLCAKQVGAPTPLIAAMRCYVASKLGDEIEIPEELL